MRKNARSLVAPLLLLAVCVIGAVYVDGEFGSWLDAAGSFLRPALEHVFLIGAWLAGAWCVIRTVDLFVWERQAVALGRPVPRLLQDLVKLGIVAVALSGIAAFVFRFSITGFWAASSVFGLVFGIALRNVILDIFTGLAINLDRSLKIGDWVEIHHNSFSGKVYGKVMEINWRTLRIDVGGGRIVVVPSSLMAVTPFTTYSVPDDRAGFDVLITLDFSVPIERALRILLAGARAAIGERGPVEHPEPTARIDEITASGVRYRVGYSLAVDRVWPGAGRHAVTRSILDHLRHAGLTPAYPREGTFEAPPPGRGTRTDTELDRLALLSQIDLFHRSLQPDEMEALAGAMRQRHFHSGEVVIRQGDVGDSLFILAEGLTHVYLDRGPDNGRVRVAQNTPGQTFGEMSLLTGEPRSATVIAATDLVAFEVSKEHVQELLLRRPQIAEQISAVAAERQLGLRQAAATTAPTEQVAERQHVGRQILEKMMQFFRWGTGEDGR